MYLTDTFLWTIGNVAGFQKSKFRDLLLLRPLLESKKKKNKILHGLFRWRLSTIYLSISSRYSIRLNHNYWKIKSIKFFFIISSLHLCKCWARGLKLFVISLKNWIYSEFSVTVFEFKWNTPEIRDKIRKTFIHYSFNQLKVVRLGGDELGVNNSSSEWTF